MNKEELTAKITSANSAYRSGESIMSDVEYDALVDEFKRQFPNDYDQFRDSLNEGSVEYGTKVKHPYVMGSLNKLTLEKPDEIFKFIKKRITSCINVSAKVDGISCRLHYENGKLIQASTRGNGEQGIDLTDKITYVNHIPTEIEIDETIDIRGELVIFKDDFNRLSGFANARNACAGIMNKKFWDKTEIATVSFVAYTILGNKYPKDEQFTLLKNNGFYTAWYENYTSHFYNKPEFIDKLTEDLIREHDYDTDGLVIADSTYHNEEKYRPDSCVAVKGNMNSAVTQIIDVDWRGPSANGKFVPVAQLEPVQLCGTMVSQATMNNLDFISKMDLKYGSKVKIQKRGEIIPAIIEVISNENTTEIDVPTECPCCGSELVKDGPFVWCMNKDCADQVMFRLEHFIVKLGVKGASRKTLENLGISSFDSLLAFAPNASYKTQVKLYEELGEKVFTRSQQELLAAMNFKDLGETLINKIIDFYGLDEIKAGNYIGLPDGIGEITLQKFKDDISENLRIADKIIQDIRYSFSKNVLDNTLSVSKNKNGVSICFTGKLNTMGRTEAEKKAVENGFEIKGVNKNLTYLVTNDPDTNSGKGKKARELGIKIISETEFLKMISNEECDLMSMN